MAEWIEEGMIGRRSQFSTVVVYQSNDPVRLEQFLNFLGTAKKLAKEVYIFFVWRGLFRVEYQENGKYSFSPVSPQIQTSVPLPAVQQSKPIKSLDMALEYMDDIFRRDEKVFFIIHGIFQRNDNLTSALRAWVFDTVIYEKGHTIVLFTENPSTLFDEETLKYFVYVRVPASTEEERKEILERIARTFQLKKKVNGLVQATAGLNLHEVESVALESIYRFRALKYEALAKYKNDIIRKSGILDIEEPAHGFEAVGGYQVLKDFIRDNVIKILQNPKKAEKLGLRPPRGLLFFGMGGTGKTHFARALAKELKLPFLRLRTENIVSRYYGETESRMAKAIEMAEEVAPCILFIDEIDRFGQRGQLGEHEATRRTFSILLEWLGDERRKTIVVATTNRPQDLDEAFIRVGRFDYLIPVLLPDREARRQILEVHTSVVRKVPLDKDVDLDEIADRTEYYTGAELQELVLRASRNALREDRSKVTMDDFDNALLTFRINRTVRMRQVDEYLALANQFCNDIKFLEDLAKASGYIDRLEILKKEMD